MSNFSMACYHPKERVIRAAAWIDDYFGRHEYGVQFDPDGEVFRVREVDIPLDKIFAEDAPCCQKCERLREALNTAPRPTANPVDYMDWFFQVRLSALKEKGDDRDTCSKNKTPPPAER